MLKNNGVTAQQKNRCHCYRELTLVTDQVVKSDMQESKKQRKLR